MLLDLLAVGVAPVTFPVHPPRRPVGRSRRTGSFERAPGGGPLELNLLQATRDLLATYLLDGK